MNSPHTSYTPRPFLRLNDLFTRFSTPHTSRQPSAPPSPNSPRRPSPPILQRPLSIDDLHQRFSRSNSPPFPNSPRPNRPPFKNESRSTSPPHKPPLSTKLPDPPVFTGSTHSHISWEDWKLKIIDKLTHNGDHYPSEAFKIAYVLTRLGGEASEFTLPRRRSKSRPLLSVAELLDQLSDVYETPRDVVESKHRRIYNTLEQGKQPFFAFYRKFIRYAKDGSFATEPSEKDLIRELKDKIRYRLQRATLATTIAHKESMSLSDLRDFLARMDQHQIQREQDKAELVAKAELVEQAQARPPKKKPGKKLFEWK